jgi:hypothetical protein
LRLTATAVLVILPGDGGEHIEHHAVDGVEHARGEVIGLRGRHHPGRREVKSNDADMAGRKLRLETLPVGRGEAREPVDLLD